MKDRRQFFKTLLGGLGVGIAMLGGRSAHAKKLAIPMEKVPGLSKVGGAVKVKLAGKEILLIRSAASEVRGISPKCTHQNCPLKYNAKTGKVDCSCHGSAFDLSGKVLKGPATTSLKTYAAAMKDGRIIVSVD